MRLGISYNLFDGEELLEASIKSVREEAYHINIVYQEKSYYGNNASTNLKKYLESLIEKGLVDEIFCYKSDFSKKDKSVYEKKKRDIGLKIAKKHGCTHFLSMDVDEFYDCEQLKKAKNFIERKNIKCSAVSLYEYLKEPQYRIINGYTFALDGEYNFYVPFIMKIHKFWPQRHGGRFFPCYVDATRKINRKEKFYLFSVQDVVMHHMSTVRKDLEKKYANSNLNGCPDEKFPSINKIKQDILNWDFDKNKIPNTNYAFFNDKIVEKVPNRFNICLE